MVRVNSTNQDYDFFRPWSKKNPRVFHGLGAVLPGNRVLVTAATGGQPQLRRTGARRERPARPSAKVVCVDYESNLALLEPTAEKFLAGLKPLELTLDAVVGDRVNVLQLESNDALVATPGPDHDHRGRALSTRRQRLPALPPEPAAAVPRRQLHGAGHQGRQAGGHPHALRSARAERGRAARAGHRAFSQGCRRRQLPGFPHARDGIRADARPAACATTRSCRRASGGVYVTEVVPRAARRRRPGCSPGDVILELGGQAIDQDGNYDEPLYGQDFVQPSHHDAVFRRGKAAGENLARRRSRRRWRSR